MTESPATKFIASILIVVAPFAMGAFFLSWGPSNQYVLTNPRDDGYVQPRDIGGLVENTVRSTVTVYCDIPKKETLGSAWAVTLEEKAYEKYDSVFITNHHVIDDCIGKEQFLTVARLFAKKVPAKIVTIDKKNDLAVIVADIKIPTLKLSDNLPYPGYWTMVVGSADTYEGSVAYGAVLNMNASEVLVTANASRGNSGGPVVDNEGRVIGTLTNGYDGEQYNVAKSLDAMCAKILKCNGKFYWEE
jgi:S1-C subfamily serine protease